MSQTMNSPLIRLHTLLHHLLSLDQFRIVPLYLQRENIMETDRQTDRQTDHHPLYMFFLSLLLLLFFIAIRHLPAFKIWSEPVRSLLGALEAWPCPG